MVFRMVMVCHGVEIASAEVSRHLVICCDIETSGAAERFHGTLCPADVGRTASQQRAVGADWEKFMQVTDGDGRCTERSDGPSLADAREFQKDKHMIARVRILIHETYFVCKHMIY